MANDNDEGRENSLTEEDFIDALRKASRPIDDSEGEDEEDGQSDE